MAANSVILIDELVVAETNNHYSVTHYDMTMLTIALSRERRLKEWESIFDKAGLKLKFFATYKPAARNSIMALILKEVV